MTLHYKSIACKVNHCPSTALQAATRSNQCLLNRKKDMNLIIKKSQQSLDESQAANGWWDYCVDKRTLVCSFLHSSSVVQYHRRSFALNSELQYVLMCGNGQLQGLVEYFKYMQHAFRTRALCHGIKIVI